MKIYFQVYLFPFFSTINSRHKTSFTTRILVSAVTTSQTPTSHIQGKKIALRITANPDRHTAPCVVTEFPASPAVSPSYSHVPLNAKLHPAPPAGARPRLRSECAHVALPAAPAHGPSGPWRYHAVAAIGRRGESGSAPQVRSRGVERRLRSPVGTVLRPGGKERRRATGGRTGVCVRSAAVERVSVGVTGPGCGARTVCGREARTSG